MTKLVGYRRFVSKKGAETCIASVVQDASERDIQGGFIGQRVVEIFMPGEQYNYLQPEHLGKELILSYDMAGGRPYLTRVAVGK